MPRSYWKGAKYFCAMYKIYFDEKSLVILSPNGQKKEGQKDAPNFSYSEDGLETVLMALKCGEQQSCMMIADNEEEALNAFKKKYLVIQAGGGLVHTPDHFLLLIFRRGKWDLPKGKLEEGEDLAACSVREVEEETGLTAPVLEEKILVTYHTYSEKGKEILKESHWYLMAVTEKQDLQPQTDEDIDICEWVHIKDLDPYKDNMHPSVKDVLEEGLKQLKV